MKLRHRLRRSPLLVGAVARLISGWMRLCNATTRWETDGIEELQRTLDEGPIVLILWHEYLMTATVHWSKIGTPLLSLHDTSPIGMAAGAVQTRFGHTPMAMSPNDSNLAVSRRVKRAVADGASIGITGDGPTGPARDLKDAPLDWARVTGLPVYVYAASMTRHKRLSTWDRLLFPLPFGRGRYVFHRWDGTMRRRAGAEEMEGVKARLAEAMRVAQEKAKGKNA